MPPTIPNTESNNQILECLAWFSTKGIALFIPECLVLIAMVTTWIWYTRQQHLSSSRPYTKSFHIVICSFLLAFMAIHFLEIWAMLRGDFSLPSLPEGFLAPDGLDVMTLTYRIGVFPALGFIVFLVLEPLLQSAAALLSLSYWDRVGAEQININTIKYTYHLEQGASGKKTAFSNVLDAFKGSTVLLSILVALKATIWILSIQALRHALR